MKEDTKVKRVYKEVRVKEVKGVLKEQLELRGKLVFQARMVILVLLVILVFKDRKA